MASTGSAASAPVASSSKTSSLAIRENEAQPELPQEQQLFDEVEFIAIMDATARLNAFITGEVEFIGDLDVKNIPLIERNPELAAARIPSLRHFTFDMDTSTAPFDNLDVRLALKYAIDRDDIIRKVFLGEAIKGNWIRRSLRPCRSTPTRRRNMTTTSRRPRNISPRPASPRWMWIFPYRKRPSRVRLMPPFSSRSMRRRQASTSMWCVKPMTDTGKRLAQKALQRLRLVRTRNLRLAALHRLCGGCILEQHPLEEPAFQRAARRSPFGNRSDKAGRPVR